MWAMIVKEFRQLRRDRRTLAMMIVLPVLLLVVFGYAASFDVKTIPTVVACPLAGQVPLRAPFHVVAREPAEGLAWAQIQLRDNRDGAALAVVTGARTVVLVDGSQLFTARSALTALAARSQQTPAGQAPVVRILYNPQLKTSYIMIPGLAGVVLAFIGIIITSLGVVRERQTGTLEQLAVMPLHPRDVFLGKIVPYFAVACVDLAIVLSVGVALFGVPFRGSYAVFGLGALLFLFVTLGLGVLISSVSENQGQAIQLSFMFTLPQVLLSGLIFPLDLHRRWGALDLLPAAADVLQRDLPRGDAARRADRAAVAADAVPGPARADRDGPGHAALPRLPVHRPGPVAGEAAARPRPRRPRSPRAGAAGVMDAPGAAGAPGAGPDRAGSR